ncbi:Uncharacterized protein DAT39_020548, partial [Clarias magur]
CWTEIPDSEAICSAGRLLLVIRFFPQCSSLTGQMSNADNYLTEERVVVWVRNTAAP